MKTILPFVLLPALAFANDISIYNEPFGSGVPAQNQTTGKTQAAPLPDGLYHAPGYMPGYPTASPIWPRVVQVRCKQVDADNVECEPYTVTVNTGRGEYLFIQPIIANPVAAPKK